jgi:hypothetical protein
MAEPTRLDLAIEAAADALLSVSALQTGLDPMKALDRAMRALGDVMGRAQQEQTLPPYELQMQARLKGAPDA